MRLMKTPKGGKTSLNVIHFEELPFVKQNSTWQRVYHFSLAKIVSQIQLCSRKSIQIMKNLFKVVFSLTITKKLKFQSISRYVLSTSLMSTKPWKIKDMISASER